jgi:putative spermidine/putrescine transport system ATP-binding protein
MDEPLSALDKKLREEIQFEIRRIHQETGVTILYVTHDQEEALRLSDRIAIFNKGKIEQVGTGPELYANPATHFVADFIGDSAFLAGELAGVAEGRAGLRFADGSTVAAVPLHGRGIAGQAAELMLRPERIELSPEPGPEGASLPVTVEDLTFLGNNTTVSARTGWGGALSVRLNFGHPLAGRIARGDRLHIRWAPEAAHAFVRG